jgi:hypothetical protein
MVEFRTVSEESVVWNLRLSGDNAKRTTSRLSQPVTVWSRLAATFGALVIPGRDAANQIYLQRESSRLIVNHEQHRLNYYRIVYAMTN